MKKTLKTLAAAFLVAQAAHAQTLVDIWSYTGGGLSPASYGGQYRPSPLLPDSASNSGGSIVVAGLTSGGLGSSGFPTGYGGIYTFFSANPSFTLQTSNLLDGVETITISFLADGGTTYDASTLLLNYNLANPALASTSFLATPAGTLDTPIGPRVVTLYTWTWDVAALGTSSGFSTTWTTNSQQHMFYDEITLTQAVPEPTVIGSLALGAALLGLRRRRVATAR